MSHRLQVLISLEMDTQLREAARRSRMSKGEWVRRVLQESLRRPAKDRTSSDPLVRLESLGAPTGDIDRMLSEIDCGRR
jgi:hypothetical protein